MKKIVSTMVLAGLCTYSMAFDYKLKPTKVNESTWCFLGKLELNNLNTNFK